MIFTYNRNTNIVPIITSEPAKVNSKNINLKEVEISGVVLDEQRKPIQAEISLNNQYGVTILDTVTDSVGKYKFKAILNKKEDYSLVYYNEERFIETKTINISNKNIPYKNLTTILPKLKGGKKYVLGNIYFVSDTSEFLPSAAPSLEALYKLMKKNRKLVIRIEGHINGAPKIDSGSPEEDVKRVHPPGLTKKEAQLWLSEERAKAVYVYLINKGIAPERMSIFGYGASKMLFPQALNAAERRSNRRVEINVISF